MNAETKKEHLPRLIYLSDVPVESSYHGSALIFRLLQDYPTEKLRIIEGNLQLSLPKRRLPDVKYSQLHIGRRRWLNTRFHRLINSWYSLIAKGIERQIPDLLNDFKPQAVLTVAHSYSWMTAAAYANRSGLPLHLIVHDDWPRVANLVGPMSGWLERNFTRIYKRAASRMCVSPYMVKEYKDRYGIDGITLYPSMAEDQQQFELPPQRIKNNHKPFTLAYAGSLHACDYGRLLSALAKSLNTINGRLKIFGPHTKSDLIASGIVADNVELGGFLPSKDLIHVLRNKVDALFLPMSFRAEDSIPMALNFPSKLTDYTVTGLPILVWGPQGSSAVKWAQENPGVAAIVTDNDDNALRDVLKKLATDPDYRWDLGISSMKAGKMYFSADCVKRTFYNALTQKTPQ